MLEARYSLAARHAAGKEVLEVACGAGIGLGRLVDTARRVVGGDYTRGLLRRARLHYGDRVSLVQLDGEMLPFAASTFDVVVLYEALYYLRSAERFVDEARRVLRERGQVLLCAVNPEWRDFNPSPFSTRYYRAPELRGLLEAAGFRVELWAGFPAGGDTPRQALVSVLKRTAVWAHLIPHTMKGKQLLKRVFLGRLTPLPAELGVGNGAYEALQPLSADAAASGFKVLYAVATRA